MTVVNLTPDTEGLLRWIRHVAVSDKPVAMKILVEGWPMSEEQAEEVLNEQQGREADGGENVR